MTGELSNKPDFEEIISSSAAVEEANVAPASDELRALADRLDLLTADFGRWESYKAASTEYVTEFTTELRWHRRIRLGVTIAGVLMVLFLAILLVCVLRYAQVMFGNDPSHALTALVAAAIGGMVVIVIALIKGVYTPVSERNAGLPMPEHIKELVEVGKNLFGK